MEEFCAVFDTVYEQRIEKLLQHYDYVSYTKHLWRHTLQVDCSFIAGTSLKLVIILALTYRH